MIWVAWLAATMLLAACAAMVRDKHRLRASLAIAVGLALMQPAQALFPTAIFLAASMIWVGVALYVAMIDGGKLSLVALPLVASSACYFIARFAGFVFEPNIALLAADMFGLLALLTIAGGMSHDVARGVGDAIRGNWLGRNN